MRIAALYDIHGNLPALDAVLEEVRRVGVDRIVIGGDVLPGPLPRETLGRLPRLEIPTSYIIGNGDREVIAHLRGTGSSIPESSRRMIAWTADQLLPGDVEWIASWPATIALNVSELGDVLFCHATPRNDVEIFTRASSEDVVLPMLAGASAPTVVCGHTHMQFDRMFGATRVVNAGSVGMPFAAPGAYWALLGPLVELRRTPYDFEAAADIIAASEYPEGKQFAATNVLSAPSEHEMLERMTAAGAGSS